jgi:hypothetical protein
MELWLALGGVLVVVIFALWRSRSRTPVDEDAPIEGLPDDLRDKNTGARTAPGPGGPFGQE